MVTLVGQQTDFTDALNSLIELDYDAIESYNSAIKNLESKDFKEKFERFREDHIRHVDELSAYCIKTGKEAPKGPDIKQWLTKGKTELAALIGDKAILFAMKTNEIDTNTAYERVIKHKDCSAEITSVLQRGKEDERLHLQWIEQTLSQL